MCFKKKSQITLSATDCLQKEYTHTLIQLSRPWGRNNFHFMCCYGLGTVLLRCDALASLEFDFFLFLNDYFTCIPAEPGYINQYKQGAVLLSSAISDQFQRTLKATRASRTTGAKGNNFLQVVTSFNYRNHQVASRK